MTDRLDPIDDSHDAILESALEEVLGGVAPPDLTPRILAAFADLSPVQPPPVSADHLSNGTYSYATNNGSLQEPPIQCAPQVRSPKRKRNRQHSWLGAGLLAASLIGVGLAIVYFAQKPQEPHPLAHAPDAGENGIPEEKPAKDKTDLAISNPQQEEEPADSGFDLPPFGVAGDQTPAPEYQPPVGPEPSLEGDVIANIDRNLTYVWAEYKVQPAQEASDAEWLRRVYLRVLGRIPTVEELETFADAEGSPSRRGDLIDEMLAADGPYAVEFAANWANIWTNILIGRLGGMDPESPASREGLRQYLSAEFRKNTPWPKVVYELVSATGSASPAASDFNGAVNFLLASHGEKETLAADRTARIFLGKQLQCAQCHRHPTTDWQQEDFWAFNSFFRQMHVEKGRQGASLVNRDFWGEGSTADEDEAEVYFELPNGRLKAAYPRYPGDSTPVPASGIVSRVNRRQLLAQWIAKSPDLARVTVNRYWAHFLGYGFTQPVDDLGPHNPPSHAELFDSLTTEFTAHGYDLKKLIRWIVLSDPFGRSSRAPSELVDAPENGTIPLFSRYYVRAMQPEQVFRSLQVAADTRPDTDFALQAQQAWIGQMAQDMNTDEGEEIIAFSGINQTLQMMNGPLMQEATSTRPKSFLSQLSASSLKPAEKIEHLFLAAVARAPTAQERALGLRLLREHQDNEIAALETIWWALLNSNEFILDH